MIRTGKSTFVGRVRRGVSNQDILETLSRLLLGREYEKSTFGWCLSAGGPLSGDPTWTDGQSRGVNEFNSSIDNRWHCEMTAVKSLFVSSGYDGV